MSMEPTPRSQHPPPCARRRPTPSDAARLYQRRPASLLLHPYTIHRMADPSQGDRPKTPPPNDPAWQLLRQYAQIILNLVPEQSAPTTEPKTDTVDTGGHEHICCDHEHDHDTSSDDETITAGDYVNVDEVGGQLEAMGDSDGEEAVTESRVRLENLRVVAVGGENAEAVVAAAANGESIAEGGLRLPPFCVIAPENPSSPLPQPVHDHIVQYLQESDASSAPSAPSAQPTLPPLSSILRDQPPAYPSSTRELDVHTLRIPPQRTRVRTVTAPAVVGGYEAEFRSVTTVFPDGASRRERSVRVTPGEGADPERLRRYVADEFNPWHDHKWDGEEE